MKLFIERLIYSLKKELKAWSIVILFAIPLMLVIFIVGYATILLPMQFLEGYIGEFAALWVVAIFIVGMIIVNWKTLKGWFIWQFIEPFQKNK